MKFSFETREVALKRYSQEVFDVLVVGGGITGAAVARDATTRGLKVALIEKNDFAYGTSSRSSKLIHGGLRYLQNLDFHLVFEALAERALLLKTMPNRVHPLPFYFPVYKGDPVGMNQLSMGLWLYDLLALFRAPGFHTRMNSQRLLKDLPFLKPDGLAGGFRYYDASMWDDVMVIEILRDAVERGAAVTNYVEATTPIWEAGEAKEIKGFRARDREKPSQEKEIEIHAKKVIICAGPWTDEIGHKLDSKWEPWLAPSRGLHIVFDHKRLPVPGAMVMEHPSDGRISFVIPRPDYGAGVTIVGTTDGPSPKDPSKVEVLTEDVRYLMELLTRYFPTLDLKTKDIVSAYVGVRPLMGAGPSKSLAKVSREHYIDLGPGNTVMVAGGKYTTHRVMAEEIVDFTLKNWGNGKPQIKRPSTKTAPNRYSTQDAVNLAKSQASKEGLKVDESLWLMFGAEALDIVRTPSSVDDPEGFPFLEGQLKHSIQNQMCMHLQDFYLRRAPFYLARKDHGMPWADSLSKVFAEIKCLTEPERLKELEDLKAELDRRSEWSLI